MDAHDQLLLSEGVCRQLEILTYHPDVEVWRGRRPKKEADNPKVPTVRVNVVDTIEIPPQQQVIVQVRAQPLLNEDGKSPLYIKQTPIVSSYSEMLPEDVLLQPNRGFTHMILSNPIVMP